MLGQESSNFNVFFQGSIKDQDSARQQDFYTITLAGSPEKLLSLAILNDVSGPIDTFVLSNDSPGIIMVEKITYLDKHILKVGYEIRSSGCTQNAFQSLIEVRNRRIRELVSAPLFGNGYCLVKENGKEFKDSYISRYELIISLYADTPEMEAHFTERTNQDEKSTDSMIRYRYDKTQERFFQEPPPR